MRGSHATLVGALALRDQGALVSIVGGGGKSALLFALGARLPGRTILTTTTRIFAAQITRAIASREIDSQGEATPFDSQFREAPSGLLLIGRVDGDKALGVDPSLPARWLAHEDVRHVIVEADGSRMRPIKVPAEHEPVIAIGTTDVVIALGIDALDSPLATSTHRPERVHALLDLPASNAEARALCEEDVATLVSHRLGGMKDVPDDCRVVVMINKVETDAQELQAMGIAEKVLDEPRIDRVIVGALEGEHPDEWKVYRS